MSRLLSLAPLVPSENELVAAMLKIPFVSGTSRTLPKAEPRKTASVLPSGEMSIAVVFLKRSAAEGFPRKVRLKSNELVMVTPSRVKI